MKSVKFVAAKEMAGRQRLKFCGQRPVGEGSIVYDFFHFENQCGELLKSKSPSSYKCILQATL